MTLVLRILLDDHLRQFVVRYQVSHTNQLVENIYGEGLLFGVSRMQRIPSYPFTLFYQVEQLQHAVVFSQFFHDFLVLEVHLVRFFQSTIHVLQFVVQFDLSLNQSSHADKNVLYRCLTIYLLYFYTAEIFHFSKIGGTFADAAAQTIDIGLRRKKKDHI